MEVVAPSVNNRQDDDDAGPTAALPQSDPELLDLIVDGARAMGVWTMSWTQIGDLWGMVPADGKRIDLHGMDYFRLDGDRIVRTRHVEDWFGVLLSLGAFGA